MRLSACRPASVDPRRLSLCEGKALPSGYRLRQALAQNGAGEVWEAEARTGETVALKFLQCASGLAAAEEVRNILNVRQVEHPNLIRIDQAWAEGGRVFVAMELADGSMHDLAAICRAEFATPLPKDEVCQYLTQAARVLDHLNARRHCLGGRLVGIQHGAVKPGNLLVVGEALKLADFGLSGLLTAPLGPCRRPGAFAYSAPEIFRGQRSTWTDQYALAVTYCELRGGRRPFPHSPSRLGGVYTRPEPDLRMLPSAERPIVAQAMATIPQDRWATCEAFLTALNRVPAA